VYAAVTVGQGFGSDAADAAAAVGDETSASTRLKKARLRLAEAQGIIPAGASDRYESLGGIKVRTALGVEVAAAGGLV
jgi:hypothetical protein